MIALSLKKFTHPLFPLFIFSLILFVISFLCQQTAFPTLSYRFSGKAMFIDG